MKADAQNAVLGGTTTFTGPSGSSSYCRALIDANNHFVMNRNNADRLRLTEKEFYVYSNEVIQANWPVPPLIGGDPIQTSLSVNNSGLGGFSTIYMNAVIQGTSGLTGEIGQFYVGQNEGLVARTLSNHPIKLRVSDRETLTLNTDLSANFKGDVAIGSSGVSRKLTVNGKNVVVDGDSSKPSMLVGSTGTGTVYSLSGDQLLFNDVFANVEINFLNSTSWKVGAVSGRKCFTAPQRGVYNISMQAKRTSTNSNRFTLVLKNGTSLAMQTSNEIDARVYSSTTCYLQENEELTFWARVNAIPDQNVTLEAVYLSATLLIAVPP